MCKQDLLLWRSQVPTLEQTRSDKANARGSEGRAGGPSPHPVMSRRDEDIKDWKLRRGSTHRGSNSEQRMSSWEFEAYALADRQLVHSEWAESEDDARHRRSFGSPRG